jgi:hypothetical protein
MEGDEMAWGDERGSVLVAALGGLVGLSALALAVALLATVETGISGAERARLEVQTIAESALEAAVASLGGEADWDRVLAEGTRSSVLESRPMPHVPGWGVIDVVARTRALQEESDARNIWGANRSVWRLYVDGAPANAVSLPASPAAAYAIVWLADDEAEADDEPLRDNNGLLTLRAESYGFGGASAAVLATVRRSTAGVELLSWRAPDSSD